METSVRTSFRRDGILVENPGQRFDDEMVRALEARRTFQADKRSLNEEGLSAPGLQRLDADTRRKVASALIGDSAVGLERLETELKDAATKRSDEVSAVTKERASKLERLWTSNQIAYTDFKWSDFFTRPVDHSFWWAQTQPFLAPGSWCEFRDEGLFFWGGPKEDGWNEDMHASFGAVALFALQPDRFPTSPSGLFTSSPHVELFGGVVAHGPNYDLLQGNGVASCQLFLRQTIFQNRFGPTGPVNVVIAEAKGHDAWRLFLKNTGYSLTADMPGFKAIPPVTYNQSQVAPNDLLAEVEVRFDIYLKSAGALLWCDPHVLLRTFQWAPTPA